ncbi:MAG: hypothetical protein ACLTMP_02645 [Eggerthella lenta]
MLLSDRLLRPHLAAAASFASGRSSGVAGGFQPVSFAYNRRVAKRRRASSLQRRKSAHAVIRGIHLLIANPAAQNGNGAAAAQRAVGCCVPSWGGRGRARSHGGPRRLEIAERAEGCSTVIALGGDSVIHGWRAVARRPAARGRRSA